MVFYVSSYLILIKKLLISVFILHNKLRGKHPERIEWRGFLIHRKYIVTTESDFNVNCQLPLLSHESLADCLPVILRVQSHY